MGHDYSLADIAAANGGMNNEMWNNPFIYLVWLAVLGRGGLFGGNGDLAAQGALTRSDLFEGFNNQETNAQLRGITNGLCDGFYAVNSDMKDGFYMTREGIAENRFAAQQCCCETNRNIDAVRYENAKNTCTITTAIHEDGEKTRALMIQQQIQVLRDRNAALNNELQSAQLTLAQSEQSRYLLNNLGRYMPYAGCGCACSGSNW